MQKPFVVTISHNLGKEEAMRRLRNGLADVTKALSDKKVVLLENSWRENRLDFSVKAVGQTATGSIEVEDTLARLEVLLPWMLAVLAERAKGYIEQKGTALLERK